jgi:hypothetical protein
LGIFDLREEPSVSFFREWKGNTMDRNRFVSKRGAVIILVLLATTIALPGMPGKPAQAQTSSSLFTFVQTVQVTPDEHFKDTTIPGNILYIPASDRFVVILKTFPPDPPLPLPMNNDPDNPGLDTCPMGTIGYKEYTTDMQPTGRYGYLSCGHGDLLAQIIGNDIYVAKSWNEGPGTPDVWRLEKYDAVTWERLGRVDIPLDSTQEWSDGPTISFINGLITISGEYFPGGTPDGPLGRGSHHHFVTTDLQLMGEKILVSPDVPSHCPEASLHQLPDGDILMFAASAYFGDLVVLRFDKDWKFIDEHTLRSNAFFPIGSVAYGGYWFVAYIDVSKKPAGAPWPAGEPPYRNVGFAAFNANWNLVQDEKVTDFDIVPAGVGRTEGENPSVQLVGNRLYVSYTVSQFEAGTMKLLSGQAYVNVYELAADASSR